ncbi:hypothetical protein DPV78_012788 [Talaromyces pinophilus]|nr:hypothetical protein DPV78_012788 [Talaromyces pinophilus]
MTGFIFYDGPVAVVVAVISCDQVPYTILCKAMMRSVFHPSTHVPLISFPHNSLVLDVPKVWKHHWDTTMTITSSRLGPIWIQPEDFTGSWCLEGKYCGTESRMG